MLTEIRASLRPAIVLLLLLSAITGLAYSLVMTAAAQILFPRQANGTLVQEGDRVLGSELIGQSFSSVGYFHGRPSAAGKGYDAAASAATNLAPGSKDLRDAIAGRVAELRAQGLTGPNVPPDLVATSASGLDPHISPEAAFLQMRRVAAAHGLPEARVRALVQSQIERPFLGFIGEPRVNVLLLNRQLDRLSASGAQ